MVNTKIKLIICLAAKDGEALYSQQKQERELTVAQIMEWKRLEISSRKLEIPREHFMQKWAK